MKRAARFAATLALFAVSSSAGTIRYDGLETYDTGIRLGTGRWRIGAKVQMTYFDFWGRPAETEWRAELWINNVHDGSSLVSTTEQTFTGGRWECTIEGTANFSACYQGKSWATAGGDTKQVGGNHVCTDPRPVPDTPPCDEDCQTPIVISTHGGYHMTSLADGVRFDIDGDGDAEQIAWTQPDGDVGFLALDRNRNGVIDSGAELFGNSTVLASGTLAANGFHALSDLDSNHDGKLDPADPSWPHLLLWRDMNHDGASSAGELEPLIASEISAISTDYKRSGRKDSFGNEFRYMGEFLLAKSWQKCFDVFLVVE